MKNLKESLLEKGNLDCGCKVSMKLVDEMEAYGFVPSYSESFMLPLGQVTVCSNRVVACLNGAYVRFPIFQSISHCDDEMLLMKDLYVPSLFFSEKISVQRCFQTFFKSGSSDELRKISQYYRVSDVVEVEGKWYYKIKPQNWLFTSESPIRAVADDYLVVCRRINSVTGVIVYETYRPEDLVITFTYENLNPLGI